MRKKLKNVMYAVLAAVTVLTSIYPASINAETNLAVAIPVVFNNSTGSSDSNIESESSSFCDIDFGQSMKMSDTITMNYRYYIPAKLFKEGTSLCFNPTIYAEFTASSTATTGDSYDSYFYVENAYGGLTVTKENGEYKVYDYAKDSSKLTESKYAKVIIRGNYVAVYVKKAPMKTTSSDYYEADTGTADEDGEVVNSPKPISEILGSKKANCRLNISVYGLNTKATGSIYFDVVRIKSAGNEIYTNFNQDKETYSFESGTTVSGSDLTPSRWNLNDLQTLTTKFTTRTYTASQLRRSSVTTKIGAKACTPISYQVTSGSKYVSVTSSGKVTLKKGTPKGTYKIKVTARARFNFPKKTTTVTIKVK